ncbi:MAG TPA: amidohydrolase family protein [bacterium]|nr:amidohydrolase family protein [bacterium]
MSTTLLKGGTFFDGRGGDGRRADVLVENEKVTRIAETIDAPPGASVIDATGRWVMPGFIDLHTHYDAEVELLPGLQESVRHGVTSVVMGSCSLSLAIGDPTNLADMFCRVEAIPRSVVLPLLKERKTWNTPTEYLDHLDSLPLGPNVSSFFGHSAMRMHTMGIGRSLEKKVVPTSEELGKMDRLLAEALDVGYLGMSIQTLPWDKMDGEEFRSRPLPSVFARWSEYRHFARALRARDRVLQAVPNVSTKINAILLFLMSTGVFRKRLRTTAISMMDIRADRFAFFIAAEIARFLNSALGADLRLQALPEVFDLWADGVDLVVFEEFGAGTAALHLADLTDRAKKLRDPEYRAWFKKEWRSRWIPRAFHRNLEWCEVLDAPDASLKGKTFTQIANERGQDVVDTFLDLCADYGKDLRWFTVMGNDRPDWLEWIVSHPAAIIGFSDAGAHLRQMAHYNFPLRMLKLVRDAETRGKPFMSVGRAVHRLTAEIGDWLGMDAGTLAEGKRADLVVVDPAGLDASVDQVAEEEIPFFGGLKRLVRRNDRAVSTVMIGGKLAWSNGAAAPALGREKLGRVLRAN